VKPGFPFGDILHRLGKILPDATRAVGGRDTAFAHVFKDTAAEVRDYQPVDDDNLFVEAGHFSFLAF
jgi:hypothetical protein